MKIIRAKDYQEASQKAANLLAAQILLKPDTVLGLATGSSPLGIYRNLSQLCARGELDFSGVRTVNLDEYVGLDPDHDQSYAYFMRHNFFDYLNILPQNTNIPNGLEADAGKECLRYDRLIRDLGGIDLQLLGIGANGHIGFNEPCGEFVAGTHCVELTDSTIDANARFFANRDMVPRNAYTMGIRDIMQAKKVVMIVTGENKAQALRDAFLGPIVPQMPASILQMHPDFTLVADEAALCLTGGLL